MPRDHLQPEAGAQLLRARLKMHCRRGAHPHRREFGSYDAAGLCKSSCRRSVQSDNGGKFSFQPRVMKQLESSAHCSTLLSFAARIKTNTMYGNICRQDGRFGVFSESPSKTNMQVSPSIVALRQLLTSTPSHFKNRVKFRVQNL